MLLLVGYLDGGRFPQTSPISNKGGRSRNQVFTIFYFFTKFETADYIRFELFLIGQIPYLKYINLYIHFLFISQEMLIITGLNMSVLLSHNGFCMPPLLDFMLSGRLSLCFLSAQPRFSLENQYLKTVWLNVCRIHK